MKQTFWGGKTLPIEWGDYAAAKHFLSTFWELPTNDKFPEFTCLVWLMCACSNIWYDSIKAVMYHLKKFKHTFLRWSKSYLNINHELKIKTLYLIFLRFIAAIYILAKMASHAFYIYIANVHERDADSARWKNSNEFLPNVICNSTVYIYPNDNSKKMELDDQM